MGASATKIGQPYNHQMISREPTLERLDVARRLLLEPFGLDESDLIHTLSAIKAHKVDEAAAGLVLRVKLREPVLKAQSVRFDFFRDHGFSFGLKFA